ncbi:MAG: GerMN domain-containing protein [Desulfobacteraceae bacterium]|nr:GerMN domain-containing protein [Desulfobacteraceae bacterium]
MATEKRLPVLIIVFGFAIAIVIAAFAGWRAARHTSVADVTEKKQAGQDEAEIIKRAVHLYFGDPRGHHLMAEQRIILQSPDPVALCHQLITALIAGPREAGSRTIPSQARLRAVFLLKNGTAVIDFEAGSFDQHPGGAGTELLTVYSIVNTLILNVETIRSVKILVGGQEAATLAGHVDLQQPIAADMLWVR